MRHYMLAVWAALLLACSNETSAPSTSQAVTPQTSTQAPAVTGAFTGGFGGGLTFFTPDGTPIATCAEILSVTFTVSSGGAVSGSEDGTSGETCIYLVDEFGRHPGEVNGPGNSPISGPITGRVNGKNVKLGMGYNFSNAVEPVTLKGAFVSSTHLVGTWACTGTCGSAGAGATGSWRMDITAE